MNDWLNEWGMAATYNGLCVMQETFAKEGLNYSMEGKTGNTLNSHRLIALAGQQGLDKQDKLVELLFRAYFTQVQQHMLSSFECIPVSAVGPCKLLQLLCTH